jgi:hypothetical protein
MKQLLVIVSLCALCQTAFAPTGRIWGTRPGEVGGRYGFDVPPYPPQKPPPPPVYVPEPWQLRIVDGVCYNIVRSVKWARLIPRPMSVRKILPDGIVFTIRAQAIHQELSDGVISTRWSYRGATTAYNTSRVTQTISLPEGSCFVRNFPDAELLTVGESVAPNLLVMRVLPFKFGQEMLPAYDCGLDNTPQNQLTLKPLPAAPVAAVKATNAVAIK